MRVDYNGSRTETGRGQRTVLIRFNRAKEEEIAEYVFEYLKNMGYDVEEEANAARISVESRDEYKEILEICKQLRIEQGGTI